jgi:hypothetical protein
VIYVAVPNARGNIESITASAGIKLTEELFATNSLVIGRVIDGSCDNDGPGYDNPDSLTSSHRTWRVVNNLNADWMQSRDKQIDFQYGANVIRSTIGNDSYTGFSDLVGVAWRLDLSGRYDPGLHGHVRYSWRAGVYDYCP